MTKNIYGMASDHAQAVIDTAIVVWMQIQTSPRNTKFDIFFGLSTFGNPYFGADGIGVLGVLLLRAETALCADAPSTTSQKAIIQEVVRVANKYIDHGPCEPSRAEPSTVATMSPYTPDVEAGRAVAQYVVVWSGDIGCRGGSGTETMNYLLVEKRGRNVCTHRRGRCYSRRGELRAYRGNYD